jgi:Ca2+:H+ antiporter
MLKSLLKNDWSLLVSYGSLVLLLIWGDEMMASLSTVSNVIAMFCWLFVVILLAAFGVVRHAEALASVFGEPYGTLILTLSVISLEVIMIATVMVTGENVPTMARDTMFGVLMIVMNGLFGLAIFVGAWKHRTQRFNIQSSHMYIGMLILLVGLGMFLPAFMPEEVEDEFYIFLIVAGALIYGLFLWVQTCEHRGFFEYSDAEDHELVNSVHTHAERGGLYHSTLLLITMLPVVLLAKGMAYVLNADIIIHGVPAELAGLVIALLILAPEGLAALQASRQNNQQRALNICLGSGLATIGLTIPVVLVVGFITQEHVTLGLDAEAMVLIVVSLLLLKTNLESGETNILMGAMHMVLFASYVALIFI